MAEYHIGISGWTYPPWRKTFYPVDLPQKKELAYASQQVNSIEINGTFYSLQRPSSYLKWYNETPEEFIFSVKAPRFITHIKRLKDVQRPLANFFASGVVRLEQKLGPLLWQLPPSFSFDAERLAAFFKLLPRDTASAVELARHHEPRLADVWLTTDKNRLLRHALEVRHGSFQTQECVALLREHRIGLVVADTAGKWPLMKDVTADFVYVRLHGDEKLYVSGYTASALARWAKDARVWHAGKNLAAAQRLGPSAPILADGRDVFVYFDNDVKTQAPYDAMTLAHLLGVGPPSPSAPAPTSVKNEPREPKDWPGYARRGTAAPGRVRKGLTRRKVA